MDDSENRMDKKWILFEERNIREPIKVIDEGELACILKEIEFQVDDGVLGIIEFMENN
jgi:hypothetical protein